MLIGPVLEGGLRLRLTTPLVSVPYVASHRGRDGVVRRRRRGRRRRRDRRTSPAGTAARTSPIEPDASSASYPLAMAAVVGGRVQVAGLHRTSAQGDIRFADLLAAMGCTVDDDGAGSPFVRDPAAPLRGIDVDMADVSDLVPTLAAVAVTASTATTISGVGFIRGKESDRLGDLAAELGRAGAAVTVLDDGLRIEPSATLARGVPRDAPRPPPGDGVRGARDRGRRPRRRGSGRRHQVLARLLAGPRALVGGLMVPGRRWGVRMVGRDGGAGHGLVRTARPRQWLKNVLVFAAPGAAGVLDELARPRPHRPRVRRRSASPPAASTSGTTPSTSTPTASTRGSASARSPPAIVPVATAKVVGTVLPVLALVVAAGDRAVGDGRPSWPSTSS